MSLLYSIQSDITTALVVLAVIIIINLIFFFWKKSKAQDILKEKGYQDKKVGALMFFLPIVAWIYVCALPDKSNRN